MRNFSELNYKFIRWKRTVNKKNRYFTRTGLLDLLYKYNPLFSYEVRRYDKFYRGRIFNLDDIVSNNRQYIEWVNSNEKVFQGYNKEDSGAPSPNCAVEGRLNAKGISFLYTCNNETTVVYELRPTREEIISIATFMVNKNCRFADLTRYKSNKIMDARLSDLLRLIADEFSTPHYAGHNYAFTQYLAGHFMNMGFEGIIFESSLNPGGENFVFFNPDDCEAISSRLFMVDDIIIKSNPISRIDFQNLDK